MAHRVGVEISDLVAAIAIGSGTIVGQESTPPITLPRGAWAGLRSGAGRHAGSHDPACNNGITKYSGRKFHLATVDQSFNYWTRQNACTVSRIVIHCAKTDCPTRSRPATTPRDVRATPKSNIFGRRTSAHLDRAAERRSLALLCVAPKQRVRRRARFRALSSVKTPGSGDANGRVGSEQ